MLLAPQTSIQGVWLGCWMFGRVDTWCIGSAAALGVVGCHMLLSDTFPVWAEGRQVNAAVQSLSYETASCCLDSSHHVVVWPALLCGKQDSLVLSVSVSWDALLVVQVMVADVVRAGKTMCKCGLIQPCPSLLCGCLCD